MSRDSKIEAILKFWFGDPATEASSYQQRRKVWFGKQPEFDATIRQQFQLTYQQAAAGDFDDWQASPCGCLALLILLDQFSRNLFRETPQAFATDTKALLIAEHAMAQGFDRQLSPIQRIFIYLPFEHCEDQAQQKRSVALFRQLIAEAPELEDVFDYALRHQAVIERFGRFPHRNRILGRQNTPEETEFLKQRGSSF